MKLVEQITWILLIIISLSNGYPQHSNHENHSEQHKSDLDKDRFYWQMPNRVLEEIGIKEGMVVADIGSGEGYFTLKIAERVGSKGKVYACDIDKSALIKLENKASKENHSNIETIHSKEDNPLLPLEKVDLVLTANVIHLIDDMKTFLSNVTPSLKQNSVLVIVQWDAEKMDPELSDWDVSNRELFTMRTALRKIYDSNYEVFRIKTFLPMQNIYFCQPREKRE